MRSDEAISGWWQIFAAAPRGSAERAGLRRRVALGRCYSTRVTERLTLDVRQLSACSRLSPGVCAYLSEAASVVLASFHVPPPPPTPAAVFRGEARRDAVLLWEAPDAVQQSSHANELEVVRDGSSSARDATPRRASPSWSRSRMLSFGWRTHEPRHVRRPPQS